MDSLYSMVIFFTSTDENSCRVNDLMLRQPTEISTADQSPEMLCFAPLLGRSMMTATHSDWQERFLYRLAFNPN